MLVVTELVVSETHCIPDITIKFCKKKRLLSLIPVLDEPLVLAVVQGTFSDV